MCRIGKAAIIGVLMLLTGCGAVRLAYNTAPQIAWWWLDGYMDFSSTHSPRVKEGLEQWFNWHRQTQLTEYANWLALQGKRVAEPTTAAELCAVFDQGREKFQPAIDRALLISSELLPTLGLAQIAHLEQQYTKKNAEFRDQNITASADARRKLRKKRAIESAERLYGKMQPAQLRVIDANLAASPYDPAEAMAARETRQRDILQTLRRWVAEKPDRGALLVSMRGLMERMEQPTDPTLRAARQRAIEFNCRASADLHNSTTPAQRLAARKKLRDWQDDLRSLASERAP